MTQEEKQVVAKLCGVVLEITGLQAIPLVNKALEMIKDKETPVDVAVDKSENKILDKE